MHIITTISGARGRAAPLQIKHHLHYRHRSEAGFSKGRKKEKMSLRESSAESFRSSLAVRSLPKPGGGSGGQFGRSYEERVGGKRSRREAIPITDTHTLADERGSKRTRRRKRRKSQTRKEKAMKKEKREKWGVRDGKRNTTSLDKKQGAL